MDCAEFNELITKYETNRLSAKQEMEFLAHKECCSECESVFNLIFEEDNFYDFEFSLEDNANGALAVCVMDKIQTIESRGYNFKINNILNILFFSIITMIATFMIFKVESSHLATASNGILLDTLGVFENGVISFRNIVRSIMSWYCDAFIYVIVLFLVAVFIHQVNNTKNMK